MPITSILDLQIKPDRVDDAHALLRRVLADTRAFDGCESVTVVQDHADPARILAIEVWASLEHDTAYRKWRAGEGAITDLPELLAAAPRLTVAVPVEGI
jgi:quinol monooxygenase YgiN